MFKKDMPIKIILSTEGYTPSDIIWFVGCYGFVTIPYFERTECRILVPGQPQVTITVPNDCLAPIASTNTKLASYLLEVQA